VRCAGHVLFRPFFQCEECGRNAVEGGEPQCNTTRRSLWRSACSSEVAHP